MGSLPEFVSQMVVDLAPVSGESLACLVRDMRSPLNKTILGITVKGGI